MSFFFWTPERELRSKKGPGGLTAFGESWSAATLLLALHSSIFPALSCFFPRSFAAFKRHGCPFSLLFRLYPRSMRLFFFLPLKNMCILAWHARLSHQHHGMMTLYKACAQAFQKSLLTSLKLCIFFVSPHPYRIAGTCWIWTHWLGLGVEGSNDPEYVWGYVDMSKRDQLVVGYM